ncbi:MAG TPA: cupin domain-containing protein [Rhodothermales bacterium]|nr:cupin domain-containing protein [Rhodothermales bacterium]HRR09942.1 cupin domain-containing protein [Rhodothermales bacterium]
MKQPTSSENAKSYQWGENAKGWWLVDHPHLSVVEEVAPPGNAEIRHLHHQSRQYLYVIEGEATVSIEHDEFVLHAGEGLEIPPKTYHQFRNESNKNVRYLVISSPKSTNDRKSFDW